MLSSVWYIVVTIFLYKQTKIIPLIFGYWPFTGDANWWIAMWIAIVSANKRQ